MYTFFYTLLQIFLVVILLTLPFFLQPYLVRGDSMAHEFLHHDILLILLMTPDIISPKRGDVYVVHNPHKPEDIVMKRVIGLPGERVIVEKESITIVGIDGSRVVLTGLLGGGATGNNVTEFEMKLGTLDYFVLGDNRPTSLDSRLFGAVQPQDFIGKPVVRVFPFSRLSILFN